MKTRVQDWCARCGFTRDGQKLTRVTVETSAGQQISMQVCTSCRDLLTSKNGKRP